MVGVWDVKQNNITLCVCEKKYVTFRHSYVSALKYIYIKN